jgi:hypothetical protein
LGLSEPELAWRRGLGAVGNCIHALVSGLFAVRHIHLQNRMNGAITTIKAGIGFGTALAITISWSVNKSILWAIVHGFLSWFYVLYFAIFKN